MNGNFTEILVAAAGHSTTNHCSARSCSSTSSYFPPLTGNAGHFSSQLSPEMANLLSLCSSWRLVSDEYLSEYPRNPSSVFGAIHLARLFGN